MRLALPADAARAEQHRRPRNDLAFATPVRPLRGFGSRPMSSPPTSFTWPWIAGYALLAVVAATLGSAVRTNTSPSLPRGLYVQMPVGWTALAAGDDVFACMPDGPAARLAVARGYVAASARDCASGGVPLLKHVLAARGDTVVVGQAGVTVRGRLVAPPPRRHDRLGRPLAPRYGAFALGAGDLWLGSDIANGYDSRYLGPVPTALVVGRARLVLRYDAPRYDAPR